MAQNTVLAAGTTAATSSDIVVAAGSQVTVGIFTAAAAGIGGNESVSVYMDTPGNDTLLFQLSGNDPARVITGPGTYRAVRGVVATSFGVFTED